MLVRPRVWSASLRNTALLGLALAGASAPAQAATDPFAPSNVPSGTLTLVGSGTRVNAFATHGQTLYLGGTFSGVGYRAPQLAPLAAGSGDSQGLAAQLEPINPGEPVQVSAVASARDGGTYVAGPLKGSDGVGQPRLLRLTADGQLDTSFRPAIDVGSLTDNTKNITAMALAPPSAGRPGGVLYVAGPLKAVGGRPSSQLAAVDAQTGEVVQSFQPPALRDGQITKLAVGSGAVYAAGTFTGLSNGAARRGLAAFSVTDGSGAAWDPQATGTPTAGTPVVSDLAVAGDVVYLAGQFTGLRGGDDAPAGRKYLAAVDAHGTGRLVPAWSPAPDKAVTTLAVTDAAVYAGGFFTQIGGAPHTRLAALDPATNGATGRALPWAPQVSPDAPNSLATDGDRVFVGLRSNFYDPNAPGQYDGTSLAPSRVDGQLRCGVAAVDADPQGTGALVPSWDAGLADNAGACDDGAPGPSPVSVTGIAVSGDRVWVKGGGFTLSSTNGGAPINLATSGFAAAGEQDRQGLAAFDVAANRLLPWAPAIGTAGDTAAVARALAVSPDGGTVFVGGSFPSVAAGGRVLPRANAAAFTTAGVGTIADWNPAPNGTVRTLAITPAGDRVYLGGSFDQVAAQPHSRIARVIATGTGAPTAWYAFTTLGTIYDIALAPDGRIFAAGTFTRAGGAALAGVAALDLTTGIAVKGWDAGLQPDANGGSPLVFSLAYATAGVAQPRLYLGGQFGASPAIAVDPATGARVGDWAPAITSRSSALSVSRVSADPIDGTVYLSGAFTAVGAQPRTGVAAVAPDGAVTAWDPSLGGTSSLQEGSEPRPAGAVLLPGPDDDPAGHARIALGGSFTTLDGHRRPALAFFSSAAPPTPASPPAITGTPTPGATLSCSPGSFGGSPGASRYAWLRDDGATAIGDEQAYVVQQADLGAALRCRQTLSNAAGSATQTSAARTVALLRPQLDVAPAVAGDAWIGGLARCSTGLWRNGAQSFTYRWKLDGEPLDGEAGETHRVGDGEQDHALSCEVTAANPAGAGAPADSAPVTVTEAPPVNLSSPVVTGDARVGATLSCDPGGWTAARAFAYAWLRDGAEIGGETGPRHAATSKDLGHQLRCLVTASNRGGTATVQSAPAIVVPAPHTAAYLRPATATATGLPTTAPRRVDVRRVRLSSSTVVVQVAAPAAGKLGVTVATVAKHPATLVHRNASAAKRATLTVKLKLGATARRRLAKAGKRGLKVMVTVTFKAKSGGATQRDRATLTLHAAKHR